MLVNIPINQFLELPSQVEMSMRLHRSERDTSARLAS